MMLNRSTVSEFITSESFGVMLGGCEFTHLASDGELSSTKIMEAIP